MSLESIRNIFPLIDDPMNIFYSKIKQWFQLNSNFHLNCKAVSRVERVVECSFNGISRTYKSKFNTITLLKEEDIDQYLYIRFTFIAKSKEKFELTTSGENIPVDISDLYIKENSPEPVILKDQSATILYEKIPITSVSDPDEYFVYIRVNKVYRNEYSQLDIQNTEIAYDELHFEDMYHQSVGRLWVLNKRPSVLTTKKSELDNNYEWKLYNIDSDNNYTLIDSSDTTPELFGATIIWPVQYGPGLDHTTHLVSFYKNDSSGYTPSSDLIDGWAYWYEVREYKWSLKNTSTKIHLNSYAESFLNTRGTVPSFFPYLFEGLDLKPSISSEVNPNPEEIILSLSYIINMNPRYLLCAINKDPLNQVLQPDDSTYETILKLLERDSSLQNTYNNKSLMGIVQTVIYTSSIQYVKYTKNNQSEMVGDYVTSIDNLLNLLPKEATPTQYYYFITQNNLLTSMFPNVKWYFHQWVYALSFKKYSLFIKSTNGGSTVLSYKGLYSKVESTNCFDASFLFPNFTSREDF